MATGEEMMAQNIAAFESGEDMPFNDDGVEEAPDEVVDETTEEGEHVEEEAEEPIEKIKGHQTKEQWEASGKDPDDYLSEDEFNQVGEIRDSGQSQVDLAKSVVRSEALVRDVLKNQQKMLEDGARRVREETIKELKAQQNEAIKELKAQQKEAIEYKETDKALEIERKINDVQAEEVSAPDQSAPNLDVKAWFDNKPDWYGDHAGATDLLQYKLSQSDKRGIPFSEAIEQAEQAVKKQFNYLFDDEPEQPKAKKRKPLVRPRAASEKSMRPATTSKKSGTFNDLDPGIRPIAIKAAKAAKMTEAEYMKAYNA